MKKPMKIKEGDYVKVNDGQDIVCGMISGIVYSGDLVYININVDNPPTVYYPNPLVIVRGIDHDYSIMKIRKPELSFLQKIKNWIHEKGILLLYWGNSWCCT